MTTPAKTTEQAKTTEPAEATADTPAEVGATPGNGTIENVGDVTVDEATGPRGRGEPAGPEGDGQPSEEAARGATIPIPVVTPHVSVYKLHVPLRVPVPSMPKISMPRVNMSRVNMPTVNVPTVGEARHAVASRLPSHLPSRPPLPELVFYGGLGAAAVFGAIEWPVAAAIGIGTAIARRAGGAREVRDSDRPEAEPSGPETRETRETRAAESEVGATA